MASLSTATGTPQPSFVHWIRDLLDNFVVALTELIGDAAIGMELPLREQKRVASAGNRR